MWRRNMVDMRTRVQRERDKMVKSIEEGKKYFIDAATRNFVPKGWGYEDWICNEGYCGKGLFLKKGKKCSFHYHKIKDEVFFVISGRMHLLFSEDDDMENACEIVLNPGDAFHVPPGLRHRFIGLADTFFVEFSTHHKDEDSFRVCKGD